MGSDGRSRLRSGCHIRGSLLGQASPLRGLTAQAVRTRPWPTRRRSASLRRAPRSPARASHPGIRAASKALGTGASPHWWRRTTHWRSGIATGGTWMFCARTGTGWACMARAACRASTRTPGACAGLDREAALTGRKSDPRSTGCGDPARSPRQQQAPPPAAQASRRRPATPRRAPGTPSRPPRRARGARSRPSAAPRPPRRRTRWRCSRPVPPAR